MPRVGGFSVCRGVHAQWHLLRSAGRSPNAKVAARSSGRAAEAGARMRLCRVSHRGGDLKLGRATAITPAPFATAGHATADVARPNPLLAIARTRPTVSEANHETYELDGATAVGTTMLSLRRAAHRCRSSGGGRIGRSGRNVMFGKTLLTAVLLGSTALSVAHAAAAVLRPDVRTDESLVTNVRGGGGGGNHAHAPG